MKTLLTGIDFANRVSTDDTTKRQLRETAERRDTRLATLAEHAETRVAKRRYRAASQYWEALSTTLPLLWDVQAHATMRLQEEIRAALSRERELGLTPDRELMALAVAFSVITGQVAPKVASTADSSDTESAYGGLRGNDLLARYLLMRRSGKPPKAVQQAADRLYPGQGNLKLPDWLRRCGVAAR